MTEDIAAATVVAKAVTVTVGGSRAVGLVSHRRSMQEQKKQLLLHCRWQWPRD